MKVTMRAARVNAGLKISEVAEKIGVSENTVSSWERGFTSPSIKNFRLFSEAVGMPMANIFFGDEIPNGGTENEEL